MSLQSSGHTLYWMPRKRHMAKIMAKSCKESRSLLVRLGSQPSRGLSLPKEKGLSALGQEGGSPITLSTLLLLALLTLPWGQAPLASHWSPSCRVVMKRRGLWTWVQIRLPYLPAANLGQYSVPFSGPEYVSRAYHVPGTVLSAVSETFSQTRK